MESLYGFQIRNVFINRDWNSVYVALLGKLRKKN